MKHRIAFVGREPHLRTKSDEFFLEILREMGDVTVIRREAHRNRVCLKLIRDIDPTLIIFYQLPPSLWHHLLPMRHVRKVWVPMWDGFKELSWKRRLAYRALGIETISFCDKLARYFTSIGLKTLPVRYFPEPVDAAAPRKSAPPYTLFLWQRDKAIDLRLVASLFEPGHIGKVIFKSDLPAVLTDYLPFKVERLEGWMSHEDLMMKIQEADYYMAPRRQEGIGFSFLEAMAMGKVVIGYNDATMNEYVSDGVNGHLFDKKGRLTPVWPSPLEMEGRRADRCRQLYADWKNHREEISAFLALS